MGQSRILSLDEINCLATGAGVLGTGGGTHPYLEQLTVQELYRQGHRAELISPQALLDDALVAVVGLMGAPLVTKERLPDPAHVLRPVRLMEEFIQRKFDAVMSIEIGSENSILPLMVSALAGIPAVDADTMGRAFPEAQMSSFAIRDLPLTPFAMSDIRDNDLIITESEDSVWTERIGRRVCTELGSIVATCSAPRTGREVKDHAILGSVGRAIRLGSAVIGARLRHEGPIDAVLSAERGVHLFRGKVCDVVRRTTGGFVRGETKIEGVDAFAGDIFSVEFQNEFALGRHNGAICATVPDLICILDSLTGTALGTETIRYGQRVDVLSLPADPIMTSEAGLQRVGPRAFGYDIDFVSLHQPTP